ncbi:sulfurtransferase TusA family protein [Allorhizobium borbori]|uniref:tRNA 2-thiouridine synthesizing protein A n=1 Tax=Allorhizobium borbori TaxID=485907 RepID=A0A7W6K2D4_9HYPH|nr:tRNA 2-thiouridine synthesizing protein A [Allorhizobium borbori]
MTEIFDLRGLKCPLPVLRTRKRLANMTGGAELIVETTDPLAVIDITHMCNEDGHALLSTGKTEHGNRFHIRKG